MISRSDREREVKRANAYLRAHAKGRLKDPDDLKEALRLKWFRLCSLYKIKDKDGKVIPFRPNAAQTERYLDRHCLDLILKARQLGFTTFEMIDSLDDCLFRSNFQAGCICHKLEDAQDIFRNKIIFAYENIEEGWRQLFRQLGIRFPVPVSDRGGSYIFNNGSSIKVSTSYRGGTLQRLHVSEFGKICRKYPEKAQEIVTGAFEAVGLGNQITLESTAEGREGYFFEYSEAAQNLLAEGKIPTDMDFQFHFFPWWQEPSYTMDPAGVSIPQRLKDYFFRLEQDKGIPTTPGQQAWYAKKEEKLQDLMQREYPSTPEEAFAQSIEGAYYATQMRLLRQDGRLTSRVAHNPSLPVYTGWDLGMNDSMVIWFAQVVGREVHLIDYLEDSGEGFEYYAKILDDKGYRYGAHFGPHDLAVRELGTGKSRLEVARSFGINFADPVPAISNHAEGINAVRVFLPQCWIDDEKCEQGVKCLDSYRKDWDPKLGAYKSTPRHDWASHGAKALETLARAPLFQMSGPRHASTKRERGGWAAHT